MINLEIIKNLTQKYQTSPENVLREYFQHLFLSHFYRQKKSNKIYFKGGTALRIIYHSVRFSEDLDFCTDIKDNSIIEQAVLDTLIEMEKEGLSAEIVEAKKTTGGYLASIELGVSFGSSLILIEISQRDEEKKGEAVNIVNDFIPDYMILQLGEKQLIAGKMAALLTRAKPRDFYDLYFLLRARLITPADRKILKEVMNKLSSKKILFKKELEEFLPKSHQMIIKDFSKTLEREIRRFL